ncbi:MAG: DUF938 domain-containing protein [Hyphomicrobiales bacterium]
MTPPSRIDMPVYDLHPVPPAALRNRALISETLARILPKSGTVLEVGSGSGAHVIYLANHLPYLNFQPTERSEEQLSQIEKWIKQAKLTNIETPLKLDLLEEQWPVSKADALISMNVIHIAPWTATLALIKLASHILTSGAPLFFYGPFFRSDIETAPSNLAFDESLRAGNPSSGIRHLDDIATHAQEAGFTGPHIINMPANNLSVVFTKA